MFPQLFQFADFGFLLLRLMVGVVFISSGWSHLKDPEARSKSIGMSKVSRFFSVRLKWPGASALSSACSLSWLRWG